MQGFLISLKTFFDYIQFINSVPTLELHEVIKQGLVMRSTCKEIYKSHYIDTIKNAYCCYQFVLLGVVKHIPIVFAVVFAYMITAL